MDDCATTVEIVDQCDLEKKQSMDNCATIHIVDQCALKESNDQ